MSSFEVGTKVSVKAEWLVQCGMSHMIGKPFEVTRVQAMPRDGEYMYHVKDADGKAWAVWNVRGVTVYEERPVIEFQFVIMAQNTEVRAVTKAFADNFEANSYGHKLNDTLKMLGLRAKWGVHKSGFAVGDNTRR